MAKKVELPIQNKQIEDLLMWRDSKKSGIVFGAITAVYILIDWSGLSLLYVLAWLIMALTAVCFVWGNFGSTFKLPTPQSVLPKFLDDGISEKQVRDFVDVNLDKINFGLEYVKKIAYGQDMKLSGMVVAVLFVYVFLLSRFSILGMVYMVALVAFVVPKFYEVKKDDVDKVIAKGSEKSREYMKIAQEKGQVYMKQASEKISSVTKKGAKKTE